MDKTDWKRHDTPAIVNAFYSPIENSIQFPAGILQGNFFGSDRPAYMNYGGIGWVSAISGLDCLLPSSHTWTQLLNHICIWSIFCL